MFYWVLDRFAIHFVSTEYTVFICRRLGCNFSTYNRSGYTPEFSHTILKSTHNLATPLVRKFPRFADDPFLSTLSYVKIQSVLEDELTNAIQVCF